jgi:hypothetical protein
MIEQYLPNNNETAKVAFRQKICQLNSPEKKSMASASHPWISFTPDQMTTRAASAFRHKLGQNGRPPSGLRLSAQARLWYELWLWQMSAKANSQETRRSNRQ